MKKLLILISFLLLCSIITTAQEKLKVSEQFLNKTSGAIETVYTDLKSTTPKITEALNSLGKELKVGANSVWNILVRQQQVWSWCFLILTLSACTNWYLFNKHYIYISKSKTKTSIRKKPIFQDNPLYDPKSYYQKNDIRLFKSISIPDAFEEEEIILPTNITRWENFKYIHLIICIVLSLLSIYHFSDMLTGFINPEYGAIKTIANIASNIK